MRPHRRELLLSAAALLGAPRFAFGQGTGAGAKKLIVVFAEGGWDVTFCLDPKLSCGCDIQGPEVDENRSVPDDREAVRTFGNIPIVVNDVKRAGVTSFFEKWYQRCHVVNGIWTGSIAHEPCRVRILTGTADGTRPDVATIAGYTHGSALPLGSVDLSGWSMAGPLASSTGRIGYQSQIAALLDPSTHYDAPPEASYDYPLFRLQAQDDAAVEAFVRSRAEALRARFGDQGGRNDRAIDDLLISLDRGERFKAQAADILSDLQIGVEASLDQQIAMAVQLVQNEMCQAVTLETRQEWDTHSVNFGQHAAYDQTFRGLSLLMDLLSQNGLLDQVVVAVLSEMTRTPLLNAAGGKDHWGHTSALLMGAVRGNAVSGGTSQLLESRPMDLETGAVKDSGALCKYDDLCAGLLELVDVDPQQWLPGVVPFRGAHPS
jgi:hypothetical protein